MLIELSAEEQYYGERVDINKKFSNGLMEPGDPDGRPEEVYNCRCTLVYFYLDYEDENTLDFEHEMLDNYKKGNMFFTRDDPMQDVLGPAEESHPELLKQI